MSSVFRDVQRVAPESRGKPLVVLIAGKDTEALLRYGFVPASCVAAGLAEEQAQARYREEVCEVAWYGDSGIYGQFEEAAGIPPNILCDSVEELIGLWPGRPERASRIDPQGDRSETEGGA